jgi:hypothetical protein
MKGRKLAWSNTGSVARISPDGLKVTFCVCVENPKTGAWVPGKESPHPIHAPDGSRFVHVQFSPIGHDLVVVDEVGSTHMFLGPTGLGRMHVSNSDFGFDRTGRSSNDAVAGLHWLPVWPTEFKVSLSSHMMCCNHLTDVPDALYWVGQESERNLVVTDEESRPKCSQNTQSLRWQECVRIRLA